MPLSTSQTTPRAWRTSSFETAADWCYQLPSSCLGALHGTLKTRGDNPDVTGVQEPNQRAACSEFANSVLDALEQRQGFVIIDRLPVDQFTMEELRTMYWRIGQWLGDPIEQNVQGTVSYDVRDTGQSIAEGARFSVTNYESSFHTDNSFGQEVLDYVGLLCLKAARHGGQSQVVSGYAVLEELKARHPSALQVLCQPFHVDRRGGVREGESATIRFPVIQQNGPELLIRYLRYWIEVGHQKAAQPLTADQKQSLDVLDEILALPDLRVEFALEPGQIFFINNRWILHNRTAFEDYPEPDKRRHLVRLWLKARPERDRELF